MVVLDRCGRRCGGRCGDRGRFVLRQRQLERSRLRARQSGGLPMKRGVPFLLGLISLSACKSDVVTQQGLFVTVDNPSSVAGIVKLKVILSNEGTDTTLTFPSTPQTTPIVFPTSFSVSVPATHSGEVDMAISGFNVSGAVVANATAFKVLQAGTFVTVTVSLQPGAAPGAGGTTGAVGTGGATGFDATPLDAGIDRSADVEISADGIGGGGGSGGFGVGGDGPPGQGGAKGTGGAPGLDASRPRSWPMPSMRRWVDWAVPEVPSAVGASLVLAAPRAQVESSGPAAQRAQVERQRSARIMQPNAPVLLCKRARMASGARRSPADRFRPALVQPEPRSVRVTKIRFAAPLVAPARTHRSSPPVPEIAMVASTNRRPCPAPTERVAVRLARRRVARTRARPVRPVYRARAFRRAP